MNTPVENIEFLKKLGTKTVVWGNAELRPNMSGKTHRGQKANLTKYVIPQKDFERIFEIVEKDGLLVIPREGLMGTIKTYEVCDFDGTLIMQFGKENMPKETTYSFEEIFKEVVRTDRNMHMYCELLQEGHRLPIIHQKITEHCY